MGLYADLYTRLAATQWVVFACYGLVFQFAVQTLLILFRKKLHVNKVFMSDVLDAPNTRAEGLGRGKSKDKYIAMLVIAHPDDEAMFFIPTLQNLREQGNVQLAVLCLSSGNADGLGKVREKELIESCKHLGINSEHVNIVDDKHLQDGFDEVWPRELIAKKIREMDSSLFNRVRVLLTFDDYGVSGHPNHISVYHGVKYFLEEQSNGTLRNGTTEDGKLVRGYQLISTNIFRKFSGLLDLPATWLSTSVRGLNCFLTTNPIDAWIAMTYHKSQFVLIPYWWRRFFVILSRYTYVNTLEEIVVGRGPRA